MKKEDLISDGLLYINSQVRKMISGEIETYEGGRSIWLKALSLGSQSEIMGGLWFLWGGLTNWAEDDPEGPLEAEKAMLRAAKEWLELEDTKDQQDAYFERWFYDEIGYNRKSSG